MRSFTEREKWIFVETVFHTSKTTKMLSANQRKQLLEYIRKTHCPTVTYDEWLEIEKNVILNRDLVKSGLLKDLPFTLGKTSPDDKMLSKLRKLDEAFAEFKNVDLNMIKRYLPKGKDSKSVKIQKSFNDIEKLRKEYDDGK